MATAPKLLTAEEFQLLGLENVELVKGELVEYMRPTPEHGEIAGRLITYLNLWLSKNKLGRAGTDGGFVLGRNPDIVRGPDVWFLRNERIPQDTSRFWEVAPDLVAEIISPSDTANVVKGKLSDYLAAGTSLVWLVYPVYRQVEAHRSGQRTLIFSESDTLEAPDLLPGFHCKVSDLFGE
jgi:Uma2 family endonuclease